MEVVIAIAEIMKQGNEKYKQKDKANEKNNDKRKMQSQEGEMKRGQGKKSALRRKQSITKKEKEKDNLLVGIWVLYAFVIRFFFFRWKRV